MTTTVHNFRLGQPDDSGEGKMQFCEWSVDSEKTTSLPKKEFLGILFNLKNSLPYKLKNGASGEIPKNHYNLIYAPEKHFDFILPKGKYASFCVEFTPEFMKKMSLKFPVLQKLLDSNDAVFLCEPHAEITIPMLNAINTINSHDFSGMLRDMYLEAKYCELLLLSIQYSEYLKGMGDDSIERVVKAHDYILQNLKFPITVMFLADMAKMTRQKFQHGFRLLYGTSVYSFVTDERMKRAVALLRDTNMTLTEIAKNVGYRNLHNFYKVFSRRFGRAPGELRKKIGE